MNHPSVCVVLLNWNSREDTLECLESVFRLSYPNFKVVLCDNASTDGSMEAFERWARNEVEAPPASDHFQALFDQRPRPKQIPFVRIGRRAAEDPSEVLPDVPLILVDTGGNLGFAGGNNVGLRFAARHLNAEYCWLLNTDTVVEADALEHLVQRAMAEDRPGMVGSSLIYYWNPVAVQALGGASMDPTNTRVMHLGDGTPVKDIPLDPTEVEARTAYVVGASMLVSRDWLYTVGLMCESYFLYFEELDWGIRAKSQYKLGYAPRSLVYHKVGGASRRKASTASLQFLVRNRIRFVARHLPDRLPSTLLSLFAETVKALLRGRVDMFKVTAGALLQWRRLKREGRSFEFPEL